MCCEKKKNFQYDAKSVILPPSTPPLLLPGGAVLEPIYSNKKLEPHFDIIHLYSNLVDSSCCRNTNINLQINLLQPEIGCV
jgi:hypothetical protein